MDCKEVKSTKYQTRKSPAYHAGECKGETKKGKDGDYVSSPNGRGVYRWIKTRKQNANRKFKKSYHILDNGTDQFRVEINGKSVEIYNAVIVGEDWGDVDYKELVKKLTVEGIYPGKVPTDEEMNDPARWYEDGDEGNSVVLHVKGNTYMFVGKGIYQFTMEDDVDAFYSYVGSNQVPYPVLLGSKYVYFMLDHTYVPRSLFPETMNKKEWADGYSYYYGMKSIKTGESLPKRKKQIKNESIQPMKGFKIIWNKGRLKV